MGEEKDKAPERVWITWDDAYPWPVPVGGGIEYVRVRDGVVATVDEVIESAISHASGLCNRGRFEDAFSVLTNALKSFGSHGTLHPVAATTPIAAPVERDNERDNDNV